MRAKRLDIFRPALLLCHVLKTPEERVKKRNGDR